MREERALIKERAIAEMKTSRIWKRPCRGEAGSEKAGGRMGKGDNSVWAVLWLPKWKAWMDPSATQETRNCQSVEIT